MNILKEKKETNIDLDDFLYYEIERAAYIVEKRTKVIMERLADFLEKNNLTIYDINNLTDAIILDIFRDSKINPVETIKRLKTFINKR